MAVDVTGGNDGDGVLYNVPIWDGEVLIPIGRRRGFDSPRLQSLRSQV